MAMIYENAHLTICATGAADGATGLIFERAGVLAINLRYEQNEHTVYVRQMLNHGMFDNPLLNNPFGLISERGHLPRRLPGIDRGWIPQEHILSKRAVHFTAEELVWDCHSSLVCECGDHGTPAMLVRTFKQDILWGMGWLDLAWSKWKLVLQQYVQKSLSKDSDRLPALSRLAQRFEEFARLRLGRYYAGLWEDGFAQGMN